MRARAPMAPRSQVSQNRLRRSKRLE